MREYFYGYYRPSEDDFKNLWSNSIFIFDTNILLNIYRYSEKSRSRFLEILTSLKEKIIIPYEVAYEYQSNRIDVIFEQEKPYDEIPQILDDKFHDIERCIDQYRRRHSFSDFTDIEKIEKIISRAFKKVKKEIFISKQKYPNLISEDFYRDMLDDILGDRVNEKYSIEEKNKIISEAKIRFKDKIPPGYKDQNKTDDKAFGDYIIWREIIDIGKSRDTNVIFVTDDEKEDWWLTKKGKTIGPRPELRQEFQDECGKIFYMYKSDQFLKYSEEFLSLEEEPEVIEEAKEVRTQSLGNRIIKNMINRSYLETMLNPGIQDSIKKSIEDYKKLEAILNPGIQDSIDSIKKSIEDYKRLEAILNPGIQDSIKKLKEQHDQERIEDDENREDDHPS